jgi:hypothetical protein
VTSSRQATERDAHAGALLAFVMMLVVGAVFAVFALAPGGDAFAVYFPVVWGWSDGEGVRALLHLESGVFRAPGYPAALFLASVGGLWLGFGIIVVTVSSAAAIGGLVGRARGVRWGLVALMAFVTTRPFLSAVTDVTPDLFGTAVLAASVAAVTCGSERRAFGAGLGLAAAVLVRFNFLSVVPCVIAYVFLARSRRHGAAMIAGSSVVTVLWAVVGWSLGRGTWWVPSGPGPLGAPQVFGGATSLEAMVADPWSVLRVLLDRLPETFEVLWTHAGAFVVVLAIVELVARLAVDRRAALYPIGLVSFTLLPLALVRPEARYFAFVVLILAVLAADGLRRIATKRVYAAVAVAVVLGGFAIDNAQTYGRFRRARLAVAAGIVDEARTVARLAGPGDDVVAEDLACALSPLRWARRPLRTKCGAPDSATEVFVRLRRRDGELAPPRGFDEEPLGPGSFFRLFRRTERISSARAPAPGSSRPPPR